MEYDHYWHNYYQFNEDFFPDETVEEIEDKMYEEMGELRAELFSGHIEEKILECLDVMNMSIKLLNCYGVKDPLHAGYEKILQTKEKYLQSGIKPL